jgi:hypothetical protein
MFAASCALLLTLMLAMPARHACASGRVSPTPTSVDLYGEALGLPLNLGDTVLVMTQGGVLCGYFEVTTPGYYGLLHVYGDDPTTPEQDGALPGEGLILKVNGDRVTPEGAAPVWTRDGDRLQVNFSR